MEGGCGSSKEYSKLSIGERMKLYNKAMKLGEEKGWGPYRVEKEIDIGAYVIHNWIYHGSKPSGNRISKEKEKKERKLHELGLTDGSR